MNRFRGTTRHSPVSLGLAAVPVAVAASAGDAVLGNRAGSQALAWLLGAVLVLIAGRAAVFAPGVRSARSGSSSRTRR